MRNTPQPFYNTVHYNTVLDITWAIAGLQKVIKNNCTIYSCYKTEWIANTEIGLDPNRLNNRGIKHDFPFINICKVTREMLNTEGEARGFQPSRGTLQMLMNDKIMFDPIIA